MGSLNAISATLQMFRRYLLDCGCLPYDVQMPARQVPAVRFTDRVIAVGDFRCGLPAEQGAWRSSACRCRLSWLP